MHAENLSGVYKASNKKFPKAYNPYLAKFSTLLEKLNDNEKVSAYFSHEAGWAEFKETDLKARFDLENRKLGGGSERGEDDEDNLNDRDEHFNNRDFLGQGEDNKESEMISNEEEEQKEMNEEEGKEYYAEDKENDSYEEERPKILLEDMEMSSTDPKLLEDKLSEEYVENNYWKSSHLNGLENLDLEYD